MAEDVPENHVVSEDVGMLTGRAVGVGNSRGVCVVFGSVCSP